MDVFATYWQRLTRIVGWNDAGISGERGEGSSRDILATARPSCYVWLQVQELYCMYSTHRQKYGMQFNSTPLIC